MIEDVVMFEVPAGEDPPAPGDEPRTYTMDDAHRGTDGVTYAQLSQREPGSAKRGWWVHVIDDVHGNEWPRRDISRPGTRAPLAAARIAALAALGWELANGPETKWEWHETSALVGKGVILYACAPVRRIVRADEPAAAAAVDEQLQAASA